MAAKLAVTLAAVLLLSGCYYGVLTQQDLNNIEEYCSTREGVYAVNLSIDENLTSVACKDGSNMNLYKLERVNEREQEARAQ